MPNQPAAFPREGMMAIVRNRRGIITGVDPYPPEPGPEGRLHLVHVEYTDADGEREDSLVWEREPGARLLEPTALPNVSQDAPMVPREFDALVRASRWTALTPTLPFTGQPGDIPPVASPFFGAVQVEDYQLVPLLRALRMPRVAILLEESWAECERHARAILGDDRYQAFLRELEGGNEAGKAVPSPTTPQLSLFGS